MFRIISVACRQPALVDGVFGTALPAAASASLIYAMQCPQTARFFGSNVDGDSDARCDYCVVQESRACASWRLLIDSSRGKKPEASQCGQRGLLCARAHVETSLDSLRGLLQKSHQKPVPLCLGRAKASCCFRMRARAPWRSSWRGEAAFPRSDGGLSTARARGGSWAARLLRSRERTASLFRADPRGRQTEKT